jgi:alcohol dehydrogenase
MNIFYRAYARTLQQCTRLIIKIANFPEPKLVKDDNALEEIPLIIQKEGKKGTLIVTDDGIFRLGLTDKLQKALKESKIPFGVYHNVVPNPTVQNVNEALKMYKEGGFDCVVAFGGGSSMDTAKAVAALARNPKKTVSKMRGTFKAGHRPDLIIAVPTTAGTGSETTVAAVILDPETHDKYACNDPKLIPSYAVLDPSLLVGLPAKVTSTVGVDALCHAVEAYIGEGSFKKTDIAAEKAIKGIFDNLYLSYQNPTNLQYRAAMQEASYQAGVAFTRAFVGYIHSMAHALGALYNTPHGLAISIVMPYVLEAYGKSAFKKEAKLADLIQVSKEGMTTEQKAQAFIQAIKDLEAEMQIPDTIKGIADPKDFEVMASHAVKEANPLYPVPKIFTKAEIIAIYQKMYH